MSEVRFLGQSEAIEGLRRKLQRVATTPLPVLITGETGTGKEVAARALHAWSGRTGSFVPVDCAALSQSLIETELFGHERGAFTGANNRREGLVHAARGGTFFLDEIGELPLQTQTRLLRLLEQRTYRPVGSQTERQADIRVVAATWRNLNDLVAEGRFRQDLYHRLTIIELEMPSLRVRPDDVELLLREFMSLAAVEHDRTTPPDLHPTVMRHLREWPWPGNVRELRNVARYITAMTRGPIVRMEDLPVSLRRPPQGDTSARWANEGSPEREIRIDLPYMEARRVLLDDFQRRYVDAQLEAHGGNVSAAARAADMDRRSIQRIMTRNRMTVSKPNDDD